MSETAKGDEIKGQLTGERWACVIGDAFMGAVAAELLLATDQLILLLRWVCMLYP